MRFPYSYTIPELPHPFAIGLGKNVCLFPSPIPPAQHTFNCREIPTHLVFLHRHKSIRRILLAELQKVTQLYSITKKIHAKRKRKVITTNVLFYTSQFAIYYLMPLHLCQMECLTDPDDEVEKRRNVCNKYVHCFELRIHKWKTKKTAQWFLDGKT